MHREASTVWPNDRAALVKCTVAREQCEKVKKHFFRFTQTTTIMKLLFINFFTLSSFGKIDTGKQVLAKSATILRPVSKVVLQKRGKYHSSTKKKSFFVPMFSW